MHGSDVPDPGGQSSAKGAHKFRGNPRGVGAARLPSARGRTTLELLAPWPSQSGFGLPEKRFAPEPIGHDGAPTSRSDQVVMLEQLRQAPALESQSLRRPPSIEAGTKG